MTKYNSYAEYLAHHAEWEADDNGGGNWEVNESFEAESLAITLGEALSCIGINMTEEELDNLSGNLECFVDDLGSEVQDICRDACDTRASIQGDINDMKYGRY